MVPPRWLWPRNGSLVYAAGVWGGGVPHTLVWVDREGREDPLPLRADSYDSPTLSPDGMRVAVSIDNWDNLDVWTSDLARGSLGKLTTDPSADRFPLWTPDGQRVVFESNREGPLGLFSKASDGTGDVERLITIEDVAAIVPWSWSPDGKTLAFIYPSPGTGANIGVLSIDGDRSWEPLLDTEASEVAPVISPMADGSPISRMRRASRKSTCSGFLPSGTSS